MQEAIRFSRHVSVNEATGCWNWLGATDHGGHGVMRCARLTGKIARAHRLAWEIFVGPIPDHLYVLRTCCDKLCVNPRHMVLGTGMHRSLLEKKRAGCKTAPALN